VPIGSPPCTCPHGEKPFRGTEDEELLRKLTRSLARKKRELLDALDKQRNLLDAIVALLILHNVSKLPKNPVELIKCLLELLQRIKDGEAIEIDPVLALALEPMLELLQKSKDEIARLEAEIRRLEKRVRQLESGER
jgi:hypothetical protein